MIDHKELSKALRVLAETPKKIADAQERCKDALAEVAVREKSGNWSPNAIRKGREDAIAERDRVIHALAHAMRPAMETVKANNNYADQPLDINSPKIQNAINVMSLMGKNLTFADQASILEGFRGDPAALRFVQSAFKKNGLNYAAQQAGDMMKPLSKQAIEEMETVLNFHDYAESQGRLDFPIERAYWTKGEFQRQIERMGYDPGTDTDPYAYALDLLAERVDDADKHPQYAMNENPVEAAEERAKINGWKRDIAKARNELANAKSNGKDATSVFNSVMQSFEASNGFGASGE